MVGLGWWFNIKFKVVVMDFFKKMILVGENEFEQEMNGLVNEVKYFGGLKIMFNFVIENEIEVEGGIMILWSSFSFISLILVSGEIESEGEE